MIAEYIATYSLTFMVITFYREAIIGHWHWFRKDEILIHRKTSILLLGVYKNNSCIAACSMVILSILYYKIKEIYMPLYINLQLYTFPNQPTIFPGKFIICYKFLHSTLLQNLPGYAGKLRINIIKWTVSKIQGGAIKWIGSGRPSG